MRVRRAPLARPRLIVALITIGVGITIAGTRGDAHKPITSPYTFNEDVLPIVRERCGTCHHAGGVAPMSLLTHAEAVPWGESIRAELMAGHMPPWGVDSAAGRFRNVQGLTGRELNVLLTWASGGTPPGDPDKLPPTAVDERRWPLGVPDLEVPLPREITVPTEVQEQIAEFAVPTTFTTVRSLRAVDLLPGTPAIVRSATVSVRVQDASATGGAGIERLIALWLPGDHPVPLDNGTGFQLPAGAELIVRVRYRKTWEYENRAVSDRSSLGLYFAEDPAAAVEALPIVASVTAGETTAVATVTLADAARAIAVYPDPDVANAAVTLIAIRPDASRAELIAFHPRSGWARRYWFREPIALPRGTRIEVRANFGEPLLPPGALPPRAPAQPGTVRLTLNLLPGT